MLLCISSLFDSCVVGAYARCAFVVMRGLKTKTNVLLLRSNASYNMPLCYPVWLLIIKQLLYCISKHACVTQLCTKVYLLRVTRTCLDSTSDIKRHHTLYFLKRRAQLLNHGCRVFDSSYQCGNAIPFCTGGNNKHSVP